MKSKPLIITAVLLLIPIMVLAVSVNLAIKMRTGCPFKHGPKIDRCKPGVIHANENSIESIGMVTPFSKPSPSWPSLLSGQVNNADIDFALDSPTLFPLRC
jgi:hypothetical protein